NKEEAMKLLAEAGYPEGKGLPPVSYTYNTNDGNKIMAEALQEMWKTNLGVNVELKNEEWAVFQSSRKLGDFQIARGAWVSDYDDPMSLLELFTSYNGNNDAQWRWCPAEAVYPNDKTMNPEQKAYDEAVAKMQITEGPERDEWIRKAEAILMDEAVIAPVYYYVYNQIIDESQVEGISRTTMGMWIFKNAKMVG
ncbi:MAG: ABC transporter substrate-binding protein, partial [Oscillospiraceae bacterium]